MISSIRQNIGLVMGRSFVISLVTDGRIGASVILSRRLCGSGAGSEVPFGQSRLFVSDNEGVAMPAHGDNGTVSSPFMIIQETWIPAYPPKREPRVPGVGMTEDAGSASCTTSKTGLKAAHLRRQAKCLQAEIPVVKIREDRSPGADLWAALNFGKWKDILHMRTGLEAATSDIRKGAEMPGFDSLRRLLFRIEEEALRNPIEAWWAAMPPCMVHWRLLGQSLFSKLKTHNLQLRGGSGVDAPRPFIMER